MSPVSGFWAPRAMKTTSGWGSRLNTRTARASLSGIVTKELASVAGKQTAGIVKDTINVPKKGDYLEPLVSGFLSTVTGEGSLDPTGPVNSSFKPSS